MRFLSLACVAVPLAIAAGPASAANYCKAFTQAECSPEKACTWRAAHAAGDVNPKSGKPFKRAGKEGCHFSPKDAQVILARQFAKK